MVDTGMGPVNGERVLEAARKLADGRPLILTLTHFHPEHGFGAAGVQGCRPHHLQQGAAGRAEGEGGGLSRHVPHLRPGGRSGARRDAPGRRPTMSMKRPIRRSISATERSSSAPGATPTPAATRWCGSQPSASSSPATSPRSASSRSSPGSRRTTPTSTAARWAAILTELIDWEPAIVVPGHGDIGGAEILVAVRDYMVDLGARVAAARKAGKDADAIIAELSPQGSRRASRLVVAGVDRLRHPLLRDAELSAGPKTEKALARTPPNQRPPLFTRRACRRPPHKKQQCRPEWLRLVAGARAKPPGG